MFKEKGGKCTPSTPFFRKVIENMFHKNEVSQKRVKPGSSKQKMQQKREGMKFLA